MKCIFIKEWECPIENSEVPLEVCKVCLEARKVKSKRVKIKRQIKSVEILPAQLVSDTEVPQIESGPS
jgi:sulfur relay (sulfurtransferase) complex TusBCD TusD component (DsrE family)